MEEWRRFKNGDKVIIKALTPENGIYYHPTFGTKEMGYNTSMLGLAGKECTIIKTQHEPYGNIYRLDNGRSWAWTDEYLEPAVLPSNNREAASLLSKE
jgi:hypothetical protein